ncbi:MAG: MotA/TolQ/ExbB proton channel family protein [Myxococcales bacterium]|nr:MotA/TolQ/ExbB proton channel family protein [Myxococcales bacterium]
MLSHKLWEMAQIGAEWVLYLLLILSLYSISIMVERFVFFWRARSDIEQLRRRLRRSLQEGGTTRAAEQFAHEETPEVVILRESLAMASGGADAVEEAAAGVREQQKIKMERGLIVLGTLGNNAPFIGLFGTVLGIINAFRDLSTAQLSQAGNKLMGSISEALIATAVGLMLAIPAVLAFNFFQRRVKVTLSGADTLLHELLAHLRSIESHDPKFVQPVILPPKDGVVSGLHGKESIPTQGVHHGR